MWTEFEIKRNQVFLIYFSRNLIHPLFFFVYTFLQPRQHRQRSVVHVLGISFHVLIGPWRQNSEI